MRTDLDDNKKEIISLLEAGKSRAEVCRIFRCKYTTLKARLDKWGCSLSNQPGRGKLDPSYKPASHYFNGKPIASSKLKAKLFRDGLKEKKCEGCDLTEWLGQPAPLELDHIDGNHFNNAFENLQILCPNCHALKPGNSGAAIGSYMPR